MKSTTKLPSPLRLSAFSLSLGFLVIFGLARPWVACAATIKVDNLTDVPIPNYCNLRQAIVAHNEKKTPFPSDCAAGDGNDTIEIRGAFEGRTIDIGSPLNAIANGTLTIKSTYGLGRLPVLICARQHT